MRVVSPVEGRFQRWGKWEEYDNWLDEHRAAGTAASAARRRSQSMGIGETITVPVDVHNWSDVAQSGAVALDAAGRLHRRRGVQAVRHARARRGRRPSSSSSPARRVAARDADRDDPDQDDVQRTGGSGSET